MPNPPRGNVWMIGGEDEQPPQPIRPSPSTVPNALKEGDRRWVCGAWFARGAANANLSW